MPRLSLGLRLASVKRARLFMIKLVACLTPAGTNLNIYLSDCSSAPVLQVNSPAPFTKKWDVSSLSEVELVGSVLSFV